MINCNNFLCSSWCLRGCAEDGDWPDYCDAKKLFDTLDKYLRESDPETKMVMLLPVWDELRERAKNAQ